MYGINENIIMIKKGKHFDPFSQLEMIRHLNLIRFLQFFPELWFKTDSNVLEQTRQEFREKLLTKTEQIV